MKSILITVGCLVLAACSAPPPQVPAQPLRQSDIDQFAIGFLDSIQAPSIAARREFCGYFFQDDDGVLRATPPRIGTFASCAMPVPARGSGVVASYHTHGAYGPRFDNEVPSSIDLESDIFLGVQGFVSTPGGRVWRTNIETQSARQLCGLGCVTSDPGFVPFEEDQVLTVFSRAQLEDRSGV